MSNLKNYYKSISIAHQISVEDVRHFLEYMKWNNKNYKFTNLSDFES